MTRLTSLLTLIVLLAISAPAFAQFETPEETVARGRELFVHQWVPGDKLSPNGDGLGPLYNATSCVACHAQGGVGGSGPKDHNAQMLAIVPEPGQLNKRTIRSFLSRLKTMHPEFVDSEGSYYTGILLHRYSTTPEYAEVHQKVTTPLEETIETRKRIRRMLNRRGISEISLLPLSLVINDHDMQYALAERNPPQLFGTHLIATMIDDGDIEAIARQQIQSKNGVSGRFTGRFGWRGQLEDLDLFIKGACAAEVGLQVQEMNQSKDPLKPDYQLKGTDLTPEQTSHLVAFVRSLPRPEQVMPEDPNERSYVNQGAVLFDAIGCAECHVKDVGQLSGVFSDFLLHDMGSEFEDPIPAKKVKATEVTAGMTMPSYYGSEPIRYTETFYTVEEQNHYKEYRTPPLWGVADSAPYMHDGRATSLRAAIEWHGGEALASRANFAQLSEEEQLAILKFLDSLKAPKTAEEVPSRITSDEADEPGGERISSIPSGTIEVVAARK
ncbi:Cytochrome c [Bremerella volcania]|uniref:Cytochrome c n=1 Tax=Bremerella volcania TaxID=2527984 RepID=A0A518C6U0_9BACT|nr:di-heme oxidoredictase family protein [Bremerella volcania]QDU74924.1 Cytochrome c [Bremerella volcania]